MSVELQDYTGGWDYRELPGSVEVGRDCYLESPESFKRLRTRRTPGLVLGDRVKVYLWSQFEIERDGLVEVGADSVLAGPWLLCVERISVGRRVLISHNVMITDSDMHPMDPEPRRRDALAYAPMGSSTERPAVDSRPVTIEDDVRIGIGAIVLKGVRIGRGAGVAAGAVVTRSVPAGGTVAGNPARPVEGEVRVR